VPSADDVILNPTPQQLADLVNASIEKAAKWLKVTATGEVYGWRAEQHFHRDVAAWLGIERAEHKKELAAPDVG
jgi:hypothetical protein